MDPVPPIDSTTIPNRRNAKVFSIRAATVTRITLRRVTIARDIVGLVDVRMVGLRRGMNLGS